MLPQPQKGDSEGDGPGLARRYSAELRTEDGCSAQQWGMGSCRLMLLVSGLRKHLLAVASQCLALCSDSRARSLLLSPETSKGQPAFIQENCSKDPQHQLFLICPQLAHTTEPVANAGSLPVKPLLTRHQLPMLPKTVLPRRKRAKPGSGAMH